MCAILESAFPTTKRICNQSPSSCAPFLNEKLKELDSSAQADPVQFWECFERLNVCVLILFQQLHSIATKD